MSSGPAPDDVTAARRPSARAARHARAAARWARLLAAGRRSSGLRVSYGHDRIPSPGEPVAGGTAKFQKLSARFPSHPADFTLLYLGSTWLPRDLRPLLWHARRRAIPVVLNQNGVGYPGWAGERTDAFNAPLRKALAAADHVLYQSAFCKRSADEWVAEPRAGWEILHNAVDTELFVPAPLPPDDGPVLLLGGDQTQAYRLELGMRTLAALLPDHPGARLLVSGRLVSDPSVLLDELGVRDRVDFVGRYAQRDAPRLVQRAHLLLHTKVNDPCPTLVLEAMACGLPVVYPASGGTVELVDTDAGVGVAHDADWARDTPPSAEALAEAVGRVVGDLDRYRDGARRRAVEHFALGPWLDRHAALFAALVSEPD